MSRLMNLDAPEEPKQKAQKEQEALHKDRDCINCIKFFDCKGKTRGTNCMHYEVRK